MRHLRLRPGTPGMGERKSVQFPEGFPCRCRTRIEIDGKVPDALRMRFHRAVPDKKTDFLRCV